MNSNFVSIGVDSPLELYTLLLGWHQYENIWMALTSSGLVFLPFLGMIIRNVSEPAQSQKSNSASLTSLKRLEMDMITALVVILIAGQPFIPLKTDQLKFYQVCKSKNGKDFSNVVNELKDDPSLYKHTSFLESGHQAKVPAWWYAVMAFSSGFSYGARVSLPCMPDFRLYHFEITQAKITDQALLEEATQFSDQCHLPSRSVALKSIILDFDQKAEFINLIKKEPHNINGEWMGWRPYLQSTSNQMYQKRFSQRPFIDANGRQTGIPCVHWWIGHTAYTDPNTNQPLEGLFSRILKNANVCQREDGTLCAGNNVDIPGSKNMSPTEFQARQRELVVRQVIINSGISNGFSLYDSTKDKNLYETHGSLLSVGAQRKITSETLNVLGALWNALSVYPMVRNVREAAPAVQAFILLAMYLILPFGLVFSSYSLKFLVVGSVGIFTVKMWSYMFYIAFWLDQKLKEAVKISETIDTPVWNDNFNFVIVSMYFVIPTLFIAMMGWAGFNVANSLQSVWDKLGGMSSSVGLAGAAGGRGMQQGLMHSLRGFSRGFKKK